MYLFNLRTMQGIEVINCIPGELIEEEAIVSCFSKSTEGRKFLSALAWHISMLESSL